MLLPKLPALFLILSATLVKPSHEVRAQAPEPPTAEEIQGAETAPLFLSHEIFEITLEADFHTIRREDRKDEDSEERPAIMRWTNPDGTEEIQDIQVQTRGNFRLSRRNCDFPPLRLNVKKEPTEGTIFEGQDKLKLVVPCKLGQDYWEQYVLSEYLVYRMFNLFTPQSFQVRLLRVTCVDSSGEDDTFTRYGFLIEDDDIMAVRNGGWKVDVDSTTQIHPVRVFREQAIRVDVFQYMIGNTDWSGVQMHNMELISEPENGLITVPFDFDSSGIVNARYAKPDGTLQLRSVRDRLFRGFCPEQLNRPIGVYESTFQRFREKKDEIYALWRTQDGLNEDSIKDTLKYLDEFYETLGDPERIQRRMLSSCRRIGLP